jgi:hypothetical protein
MWRVGNTNIPIVPLEIPSVLSSRAQDSPFGAFLGLHRDPRFYPDCKRHDVNIKRWVIDPPLPVVCCEIGLASHSYLSASVRPSSRCVSSARTTIHTSHPRSNFFGYCWTNKKVGKNADGCCLDVASLLIVARIVGKLIPGSSADCYFSGICWIHHPCTVQAIEKSI